MRIKTLVLLAISAIALSGCQRNMSSNTYSSSATGGKVLQGTVISARQVTIKDNDKLQDNAAGGLIGGVGGGVAGAAIGNGHGQTGATVGGAVLGAVAGALLQDALSTQDGMEYLVKLDNKSMRESTTKRKKEQRNIDGKSSIQSDMKADIETDTKTDVISVVQGAERPIAAGTRVYVIYNDDRPRVVPAQ